MTGKETVVGLKTADGRRPRVALVGGSPSSALVAGVLIEQFGASPVSTRTSEAALSLLSGRDGVDVVVLDLALPGSMIIAQLIRTIGGHRRVPVIALSSSHSEVATPGARAAGFAGSVLKPYSPRELYRALNAALLGPETAVAGTA